MKIEIDSILDSGYNKYYMCLNPMGNKFHLGNYTLCQNNNVINVDVISVYDTWIHIRTETNEVNKFFRGVAELNDKSC